MRLAFIAAEAENVVVNRCRRQNSGRFSSICGGLSTSNGAVKGAKFEIDRERTRSCDFGRISESVQYYGSECYERSRCARRPTRPSREHCGERPAWTKRCAHGSAENRYTEYISDKSTWENAQYSHLGRHCGRTIYRPFVAIWHLASLSLFLLATLACSGVMAETSTSGSNLKSIKGISGTCSRFEYFLAPRARLTKEKSITDGKSIIANFESRHLAKRSTSPFYPSNSALENVFSIWLRASRSSQISSFDDGDASSSMLAVPLNVQSRNRYHYYFNNFGGTNDDPTINPKNEYTRSDDDENFDEDTTPFHLPETVPGTKPAQCELFDEQRAEEICGLDVRNRVIKLRQVYIPTDMATNRTSLVMESGANQHSKFNSSNYLNSNSSNFQPMTLYTFFQLDVSYDGALAKSNPLRHLAPDFRACILSSPVRNFSSAKNSCRTCYANVLSRLKDVDSRQENFSVSVLSMLDCDPDNDLEQFSPTSNCSECRIWYRRWLLVILTAVWNQKPCLEWCNIAELACPHLSPVRRHDYAGLPSFRCTDPEISSPSNSNSTYGLPCGCMHPCDPSAPTIYWGWNVTSERPEFCKDYEEQKCPSKAKGGVASAQTAPGSKKSKESMLLAQNAAIPKFGKKETFWLILSIYGFMRWWHSGEIHFLTGTYMDGIMRVFPNAG